MMKDRHAHEDEGERLVIAILILAVICFVAAGAAAGWYARKLTLADRLKSAQITLAKEKTRNERLSAEAAEAIVTRAAYDIEDMLVARDHRGPGCNAHHGKGK